MEPTHRERAENALTIVAQQEVALHSVDGDRSDRPLVVTLVDEIEVGIGRVEQALRVECLEVDNLESLGASDTKLGLEEVDRGRLGGDVKLLEDAKGLVPVGLELAEGCTLLLLVGRRFDRVHRLDGGRQGTGLDDADELTAHAESSLEEGRV